MRKENIVTCKECGNAFNNYYSSKARWRKLTCSKECARKLRRRYQVLKNKERRHKLRAEHKCIICAEKIKPVIIYHQFCPKHKPKFKNEK